MTAVAAGTVDLTFAEVTSAQELVKSGKLRALAVASERRVPPLPDVPAASEAGMPDFTAYTGVAAVVSAEIPKAQTARLAACLTEIGQMPETREFYERMGAEALSKGPEHMREFQEKEIKLWKRIAADAIVELK